MDWIKVSTIGSFVIALVALAIELATLPMPKSVALVVFIIAWFAGVAFATYSALNRKPRAPNVEVRGERFIDTAVALDGKRFIGCHFENVNFTYKGKRLFDVRDANTFAGRIHTSIQGEELDRVLDLLIATNGVDRERWRRFAGEDHSTSGGAEVESEIS